MHADRRRESEKEAQKIQKSDATKRPQTDQMGPHQETEAERSKERRLVAHVTKKMRVA